MARMPRSALGPAMKRASAPGSQRPCSRQVTGMCVFWWGVSQMVTLTMRFCLPPTMVSPPKMTTGSSLVSTSTAGTVPPPSSCTSTPCALGRLGQGQVRGAVRIRGGAEGDDHEAVALHADDGLDRVDERAEGCRRSESSCRQPERGLCQLGWHGW